MPIEKPGEVLFLSMSDVESVLTYKEVLDVCDRVFKWIGEGKVKQIHVEPITLGPPDAFLANFMLSYPAYIEPLGVAGVKWVCGAQANPQKGLPYILAVITVNDSETGIPIAIMDGTSITAMRTAGHAGVGAKYLARKDSSVIAIIGCGVEGRSHLRIMNELFKIKEVRIFDIKKDAMDKFIKEMGSELKLNIRSFDTAKEAVKGTDVICMVTTATEPVVLDEWIEAGCHVAGTWAFDLDPKFSKTADKWVLGNWERDLPSLTDPAKAYVKEWAKIVSKKNVYADLSEIATGKKPGRESERERTVMTHLGMGALDVATAYAAYEVAKEKGIGTKIRLF